MSDQKHSYKDLRLLRSNIYEITDTILIGVKHNLI